MVILESELRDLSGPGTTIGAPSSDPSYTRSHTSAVPFDTSSRGRIGAILSGIRWADVVIVGGGELVQDTSSRLYSPFNLLPLFLARLQSKPGFAYGIGVGQGEELRPLTRRLVRSALGNAAGVTVRDSGSEETLLSLGVPRHRLWKTADCAFTLCRGLDPGPVMTDLLGVAPRNVASRKGHLLPQETRKRLGLHREEDPAPGRRAWAELLDAHLDARGGRVRFFPFHTGSLSSSDDLECREIASMMRRADLVEIHESRDIDATLGAFSECRVVLGVPLHSSILAVVTGAVPVAVPYSSKGYRLMSEMEVEELCASPPGSERHGSSAAGPAERLGFAWDHAERLWNRLGPVRDRLHGASLLNAEMFRSACGIDEERS